MLRWWLLSSLALFAGCGGMVNGPTQNVKITTIPPGAEITVDGQHLKSPVLVELERGRDYWVNASMGGFEPGEAEILSHDDSMMAVGNCVFFLCVPQIWESGSPSHQRLGPEEVEITLNPIGWSPR